MSNDIALADFQTAREHYVARRFGLARAVMQRYRRTVDYAQFKRHDARGEINPKISIIIVGYATGSELIDCVDSVLAQHGPSFEVILIDNGKNEDVHSQLTQLPICWISSPLNLLPSEGRNIGAHFARSDVLIFLDDDALMATGYLAAVQSRAQSNEYLALRGRIMPKSPTTTSQPKQYDLGETEQPSEFNLEGNIVVRRTLFQKLGGFDPLMFGHEGKALTRQWRSHVHGKDIRYCPELIIYHDFAVAENIAKKRDRQAIGNEYLDYLKEQELNRGVTILLRAGNKLAAADEFLASLVKYNTYKPIEVLLWTQNGQQGLSICRPYLSHCFIRVLPASLNNLARIAQQARYENLLIVDLPTLIVDDVLYGWLQGQETGLATAFLCSKQAIISLAESPLNIALPQLTKLLGKPVPIEAELRSSEKSKTLTIKSSESPTQPAPLPEKTKSKSVVGPEKKSQSNIEFAEKILQAETQIQRLQAQLTQIDSDIATLESRYLSFPDNSKEKIDLKDDLEERVLASCRLLIELKDAQDNLQELRIRSTFRY
jgi:GT2 family glycosyltransferase